MMDYNAKVASIMHPELSAQLGKIQKLMDTIEATEYDETMVYDDSVRAPLLHIMKKLVKSYGDFGFYTSGVYSFPVLTSAYCKALSRKASRFTFEVNECENECAQMKEAIVEDNDQDLYVTMCLLFAIVSSTVAKSLMTVEAASITTVQFAKYSADDIANGNWHYDEDSDVSLVIALNDDYEGGGTAVKTPGIGKEIVVPPLPIGHAMLFNGRANLHKGLKVLKGTREVLVFWSTV